MCARVYECVCVCVHLSVSATVATNLFFNGLLQQAAANHRHFLTKPKHARHPSPVQQPTERECVCARVCLREKTRRVWVWTSGSLFSPQNKQPPAAVRVVAKACHSCQIYHICQKRLFVRGVTKVTVDFFVVSISMAAGSSSSTLEVSSFPSLRLPSTLNRKKGPPRCALIRRVG